MPNPSTARLALSLLDLTSLNEGDTEDSNLALCRRAQTRHGNVAAVCVWPHFVAPARQALAETGIKIAAVANFPAGNFDLCRAAAETRAIVAAGGDEVDVVFPYNAWLAGNHEDARNLVAACKEACGERARLKVILETGCLRTPWAIADASAAAIESGADFIKTSTGKTAVSATEEAARAMLRTIRELGGTCGFKASGGISTAATAARYLSIAGAVMGASWISPSTFRFGASGLLSHLLAEIDGDQAPAIAAGY